MSSLNWNYCIFKLPKISVQITWIYVWTTFINLQYCYAIWLTTAISCIFLGDASLLMEHQFWRSTTFGGASFLVEHNFWWSIILGGAKLLWEHHFWGSFTFGGATLFAKHLFWWSIIFGGASFLMEHHFWWNIFLVEQSLV